MKNKDDSERTPRKACWSLEHRGTLGETALHLCFLSNNPMMTEMARALLELYPAMAFDQYEGQEYYGEWNKALEPRTFVSFQLLKMPRTKIYPVFIMHHVYPKCCLTVVFCFLLGRL